MQAACELAVWAAIVGPVATAIVARANLVISLWHARATQEKQLEHDSRERTRERLMTWRRDACAPSGGNANHAGAMDFVTDKFTAGRSFRVLTIVDQFTRECIAPRWGGQVSGST
jgi:hypothetical protein